MKSLVTCCVLTSLVVLFKPVKMTFFKSGTSALLLKRQGRMPSQSMTEKRLAPRVAAGRPGRVRIPDTDGTQSFRCGVVDISNTGCRVTLPRHDLPRCWTWNANTRCDITIHLDSGAEAPLPAELVWHQRTQEGYDVLGFRFIDYEAHASEHIDRFIILRLRAGVEILEESSEHEELQPLDVQLECDAKLLDTDDSPLYRLMLQKVGRDSMQAGYGYRETEERHIPKEGDVLSLVIYPPSWARGQRRTLRFAAVVVSADDRKVTLQYRADGSDLSQMIMALIPERIVREERPFEVDVTYVLLILGALILALMIASIGPE